MTKVCDNTSVGILVWKDDNILLIERARPPYGFAPPAGHVDDFGSYEEAACQELKEEVGLEAESLNLLIEGRKENSCRRENGSWHYWKIYKAIVSGVLNRSQEETKQAGWYDKEEIMRLAKRTEEYLAGRVQKDEWREKPGLEPVWHEWFSELKMLK